MQFFPYAEGYVNATEMMVFGGGSSYSFNYVFKYTDHLGNIRLSYGKDPATNVLKIMEENHYYPFGLKHSGYNSDELILSRVSSTLKIIPIPPLFLTSYKYKYNGKEYQDELGLKMYDYGARNYDPAIGRWMNIDPLAEKFNNFNPYNYTLNNPIIFIDPDGMDVKDYNWGTSYTGKDAQNLIRDLQSQMGSSSSDSNKDSNEEPPISLFDPNPNTGNKNFDKGNKILNGVVNSREFKKGDGIFSLYGHGTYDGGLADDSNGIENRKIIYSVQDINNLMREMSPEYDKAMKEGNPITLYLFSSAAGEENSLAARFSHAFKNVTVIGSDDKVNAAVYTNGGYGINNISNNGNLVTYRDRKKINTQSFSDFKKTSNPNVKPTKIK